MNTHTHTEDIYATICRQFTAVSTELCKQLTSFLIHLSIFSFCLSLTYIYKTDKAHLHDLECTDLELKQERM